MRNDVFWGAVLCTASLPALGLSPASARGAEPRRPIDQRFSASNQKEYYTPTGRPVMIVRDGKPIEELLGS